MWSLFADVLYVISMALLMKIELNKKEPNVFGFLIYLALFVVALSHFFLWLYFK